MLNIQSVASDIAAAIAGKLNSVNEDSSGAESNELQALIASALRKMQMVSRDEFDAQTAVLLRTRQKLEQLEKLVAELEAGQLPSQNKQ